MSSLSSDMTSRPFMKAATWLIAAFAMIVTGLGPSMGPAAAQERPRTMMDFLFGEQERRPPPGARPVERVRPGERNVRRAPQQRQQRKRSRSSTRTRSSTRSAAPSRSESRPSSRSSSSRPARSSGNAAAAAPSEPPQPEKVSKDKEARKILVVGDFLAASLADGLEKGYAEDSSIVVESNTDGSSGLVRKDHFDWPGRIGPMLEEVEPDLLVVMLGSNDRQAMTIDGRSLQVRSQGWIEEYRTRVKALSAAAGEASVPLVWVGVPSFRFKTMSEDMVFLNDIYRKSMAGIATAEFVDVWDGFVDESGSFTFSGPGVNGQTVQLRNSDGITMTPAGEEKLAFFAKRAIERRLAPAGSPASQIPGAIEIVEVPLGNPANLDSTPLRSFDDPSFDGGETLMSASALSPRPAPLAAADAPSPRDRLVVSGLPEEGVEGRADNFNWNQKGGAVSPNGPPIAYRGSVDLRTLRANSGIEPPEEMPSILDAIIEEWAQDNEAAQVEPTPPADAAEAEAGNPDVGAETQP